MSRKTHTLFFISVVAGMLLTATVAIGYAAEALKAITIGTSSVGSTFYTIAVGMADLLTRSGAVNATAEAVGGSDANARAIRDGKIEMAVLNSFSARDAVLGKGTFVKGGPAPLRLVLQGHTSLRQLIARPQSGIRSFADLKGKVLVGKRRSLQELELITKALLNAYGMTEKDLRIVETSDTKGAIQALEVGSVDAAIFPGGIYDPNVTELQERKTAVLIPIDDQHFAKALEDLGPAFGKFTIPQKMYPNLAGPVNAFRLLPGRKDARRSLRRFKTSSQSCRPVVGREYRGKPAHPFPRRHGPPAKGKEALEYRASSHTGKARERVKTQIAVIRIRGWHQWAILKRA